jgi:1-phosphofructokinase family hexose kinase
MILTVTANTTLDQTLMIPAFEYNRTLRATASITSMGGKPTDASYILGALNIPSHAIGFAAGALGEKVEAMLGARGVTTDFIAVDGETRLNTVLVYERGADGAAGGMTTITTNTLDVTPQHITRLFSLYDSLLDQACVIVLGGTLPRGVEPSFYTALIERANARGIPTIFDADQPNLAAGLAARPTYIKPNEFELERLIGTPVPDVDSTIRAGRDILEQVGTQPIITLGERGAVAVLRHATYFIPPLPIPIVSANGAGDGVLAGVAASIQHKQPIEDGLRLGFACAAAVCLLPGTADCRADDVWRLRAQIALQAI